MTKLLEQMIEEVRKLPEDRQNEAAALLLSVIEQDPATVRLDAAQIAEIEVRLAETEPEYALHEEVRAFFQRPEAYPRLLHRI